MKTLVFVPYDDPNVVNFYCANMPGEFPLVFFNKETGSLIRSKTAACVWMDSRGSCNLESYVNYALALAIEAAKEEGVDKVICLVSYAEYVELVYTEIVLDVPSGAFFADHVYENYERGNTGLLYHVRPGDEEEPNVPLLHCLSVDEFNLLMCAN